MADAQSIPPLASFGAVRKVAKADTGTSLADLAEVSHIHLFGISIIFLLTGAIFALSETPIWVRVFLVVVPYLTILMDIGSWWFTKYLDPAFFAYVVVAGGACMGLALAAQTSYCTMGNVDRASQKIQDSIGAECIGELSSPSDGMRPTQLAPPKGCR